MPETETGCSEHHQLLPPTGNRAESNNSGLLPRDMIPSKQQVAESTRGAVRTLCVALSIFLVSAGCGRYFFYTSSATSSTASSSDDSSSSLKQLQQAQQKGKDTWTTDERSANLMKMLGHDGGFDTKLCTQALSLPVLEGVDVVSYFSLDDGEAAIYGVLEYESVFCGYRFYFVSEEHKATFKANPARYMPGWGGFCAWGVSNESVWNKENLGPYSDPNAWVIEDDVLYVFRSEVPKRKFTADLTDNIEKGKAVWRSWWGDAAPGGSGLGSPINVACFCDMASCQDK